MTPGQFKLVPAGVYYPAHGGISVYVRYAKNPNKIDLVEIGGNHIFLKCPDRDLFIVSNTHHAVGSRWANGTFDEMYHLSAFDDMTAADLGVTQYMVNYTQHISKPENSHNTRRGDTTSFASKARHIVADSGGFQLGFGRLDYLDPMEIIKWYNDNADIGIVLDIPMHFNDPELYQRLGRVQAANTELMMQNKRDSLELMNIFHGNTQDEVSRYREIVERDDITRLAMGGTYYDTQMTAIAKILQQIVTGRKYEQYHMLGVAKLSLVYPLIYMAKKGLAPLITSDASTWLQESVSKGYYYQTHISEPPGFFKMFDKVNSPSPFNTLPCNCPVCSAIKYTDVLSVIGGNVATFLLAYHNMYTYNRIITSMTDIIMNATDKEVREVVSGHFKTRGGRSESMKLYDLIDSVVDCGYETTRNKYAFFLNSLPSTEAGMKSLFKPTPLDPEVDGDALPEMTEEDSRTRIISILERYESEAGAAGVKHGVKAKKGAAPKGHMKASSTSTKRGAKAAKEVRDKLAKRRRQNNGVGSKAKEQAGASA